MWVTFAGSVNLGFETQIYNVLHMYIFQSHYYEIDKV